MDAVGRVNAPADMETAAEQLERFKIYFREMALDYGTKWMDSFLETDTQFNLALSGTEAFAGNVLSMYTYLLFHGLNPIFP